MKKLVYVSHECFVEVDLQILKDLAKHYYIHYFIIYGQEKGYTYTPEEVLRYCSEHGIKCDVVLRQRRARHPAGVILAWNMLVKIRQLSPAVVYFESFKEPYLPLMARLMLDSQRVIIGVHDAVPHRQFYSLYLELTKRLYFSLFRTFHVFSQSQREELNRSCPGKNVHVARLSVYDFGSAVAGEEKCDGTTRFLFFGNIHFYKGLDYLIEAGNRLACQTNSFSITIAGHCDNFDSYRQQIKRSVIFSLAIRFIDSEEVPTLFANSDFLVLPYRDVTQSGPLMVSYNYSVPVIASDHPGFREYVREGETGFLFEPGNVESLVYCMRRAMALDSSERKRLRDNIRAFVAREMSSECIINEYRTMFDTVAIQANKSR